MKLFIVKSYKISVLLKKILRYRSGWQVFERWIRGRSGDLCSHFWKWQGFCSNRRFFPGNHNQPVSSRAKARDPGIL